MGIACVLEAAQSFRAGTEMALATTLKGAVHYVAEALFWESNYSLG